MEVKRRNEMRQLVEACQHTDTTELESEKTAVISELFAEVEELTKEHAEAIQRIEELKTEAKWLREVLEDSWKVSGNHASASHCKETGRMKIWEMKPENWVRHDRDRTILSRTQYWRQHDISEYEKQKTELISDLHLKLRLAEAALEALLSPIPEMRMDLENDAARLLEQK